MIKAGIVGISGYSGIELFHILSLHPEVEIVAVSSRTYKNEKLSSVYPHLVETQHVCKDYGPDEISKLCDIVFTAVPHGEAAMEYALPIKNAGKKMIDLSADFRIKNQKVYEKYYNVSHKVPQLLTEAVYGLPELHKEKIKKTWLVANPGCYTTAAILSIAPLLKEKLVDIKSIIVDTKSGTSGAGRKVKQNLHFSELDESFQAYSIPVHRHTPEIEQELSLIADTDVSITFVPHLVPMIRGILSVSYANAIKPITKENLFDIYKNFYSFQPFVRILENQLPNTKYVAGTNFIDIAVQYDERNKRVITVAALDNLIKGASGQAVQNMNLLFGFNEITGLKFKPIYP